MTSPRSSQSKAAAAAAAGRQALHAMGYVKIWELARLADISVNELIVMVVQASGLPAIPLHRPSPRSATTRED